MKMLTITTTKRFVKAKVTSQSIIEEHSALDDHAIAGRQSAPDDHLVALLKTDFHGMGFEAPGCDLDEHLIYVVLQYQCGRWHDRKHLLWGEKGYFGKHARLNPGLRVLEADAHFGATGIR